MKNPTDKRIVLASNSPRRRQLLEGLVGRFEIAEAREVDETFPDTLEAAQVAPYLSRVKAEAYADLVNSDAGIVLITADTVVIVDNEILGKPKDTADAVRMLQRLSGRRHKVVTGVTLTSNERRVTFANTTLVEFDKLSDYDIKQYIKEYQPFDKAGSYGIQEWIGYRGIRSIEGCFYNVMGLPLNDLYNHLKLM